MTKKEKHIPVEEATNQDTQDVSEDSNELNNEEVKENSESEAKSEDLTLDALKRQLDHLKQKADSNYDIALRAKAELENVKRRADKEVSTAHKYALEKFVPDLLPILDSLDQGILSADNQEKKPDSVDAALKIVNSVKDGMHLTAKMFEDTFKKFGVEIQNPEGQKFDPHLHQAVMMQEDDSKEPGTIIKVLQKGYVLNERVLRPAMVIVVQEK